MALLFNRKNKEDKKDKETNIGKAIYILLLFAPIFAVAVACGYVVFNKNAYQSYSDKATQNLSLVTDASMQEEGNTYKITLNNEGTTYSENIYFYETTIDFEYIAGTEISYTIKGFRFYPNNTHFRIIDTEDTNHNYELNNEKRTYLNQQTFTWKSGSLITTTNNPARFYLITFVKGSLDNVFYYQLNRLEESDLFNWSKNTGTYTVVHNTTTLLGITNTYTPMLLTYWLIISVIYFIYDIALILIWAVHKKIHLLMESI